MQAERSLSELTVDLAGHVGDLVRNEVRLARAEAMESVKHMGGGIVRAALGVALAGAAVTLALFALAYGLGQVMPLWVGAFVGAVIGGGIAYLLIKTGLKSVSLDHVTLPKTAQNISRDLRLIKENTPL